MTHFTTLIGILGVVGLTSLAVLNDLPVLPDLLVGAGAGAIAGRLLATRLEKREGAELTARRIRQIETRWTLLGGALGLAIGALGALS